MVYIALNSTHSKTTGPIFISPKIDCRGYGCICVDFNVFGVYLSGAVKWASQVYLPKTKNYIVRRKTLVEDDRQTGKCKLHSLPKTCTPPGVLKKLIAS